VRTIIKGKEPNSLAQHRCNSHADYANYNDKDRLRASLVAEQRGLCCYCLSRIPTKLGKMKIEHWHSQEQPQYRDEQLVYSNLLGACMGNEGQPGKQQHCDTKKGDRDLSRNPANPLHRVEDLVRFTGDGKIASDDQAFNAELNNVLNLNVPFIVNNRKATLDVWVTRERTWTRTALEKELQDWNGESNNAELRAFCQVVVYYIRKRLARSSV